MGGTDEALITQLYASLKLCGGLSDAGRVPAMRSAVLRPSTESRSLRPSRRVVCRKLSSDNELTVHSPQQSDRPHHTVVTSDGLLHTVSSASMRSAVSESVMTTS